ncbi:MAG: TetR/AcrR family transcriptional regulator [Comamonadaceae bacterium]|nr:MAG: TetR/AcrR family transcriptional regulator [Comamonadaceae bacterium]
MTDTNSIGKPRSAAPRARAAAGLRRPTAGVKHEDKRTAILRTAAQLFAEKGYEGTSLDMIAERLGIHKATLYHYVQNKEGILYQCLVMSFGDLEEVIASMADRSIPVLQRLRSFARSLAVAQNNDFGRCLVLVGSRPLEALSGGELKQFQRRLDTTVRGLLMEGIADGTVKPCHPGMFSALLFGALNWVPRWHDDSGKMSIPEVADTFMDMLIDGIAVGKR